MNEEIYNPKIVGFREKVQDKKEKVYENNLKMENISDFHSFFQEVKEIIEEYNSIFYSFANPVNQEQFINYMNEENDFISQLNKYMIRLNDHFSALGDKITDEEVQKCWKDVKTIISYENLLKQYDQSLNSFFKSNYKAEFSQKNILDINDEIQLLEQEKQEADNRIMNLDKPSAISSLKEQIQNMNQGKETADNQILEVKASIQNVKISNEISDSEIQEKAKKVCQEIEQKGKEAIKALDCFFEMEDETIESSKEDISVNEESISIDEEYLDTLSTLIAKIEYVQSVIANIENLPGRKVLKFKGSKETISKRYKGRYFAYCLKLKELVGEYEEEKQKEITAKREKNEILETFGKEKGREYYVLTKTLEEVETKLFSLGKEATSFINTRNVVAVASIHNEPFYVLKTKLDQFNKIFVEYKSLQKKLQQFAIENHIEIINTAEQWQEVEKKEKKWFDRIQFLKKQPENDILKKEINESRVLLYNSNRSKEYAMFANIKKALDAFPLKEQVRSFYENVIENPEELMKSKEYALDEKRQIFNELIQKTSQYVQEKKERLKENLKRNIGKTKDFKMEEKVNSREILENKISKLKRYFHLIPENKKNVRVIKSSRDAKDKKRIAFAIGTAAVSCAFLTGMSVLSNSASSIQKTFTANKVSFEDSYMASNTNHLSTLKKEGSATIQNYTTSDYEHTIIKETLPKNLSIDSNRNYASLLREEKSDITTNRVKEIESYNTNQVQEDLTYLDKEGPRIIVDAKQQDKVSLNSIKKEPSKEAQEYFDFGDHFTKPEGIVYKTAEDAVEEKNPLSTYFSASSVSEVKGILFKYNGEIITVYDEPTRNALINNGAEQVGVLGVNENSSTNDFEGFFNDEKIERMEEENEVTEGRGGR